MSIKIYSMSEIFVSLLFLVFSNILYSLRSPNFLINYHEVSFSNLVRLCRKSKKVLG